MDTPREIVDSIISRHFNIEGVTEGESQKNIVFRYFGQFHTSETEAAFESLKVTLAPYDLTPMFRLEKDQQVIYLVKGMPKPTPSRSYLNVLFFVLTLISVLISGAMYAMDSSADASGNVYMNVLRNIGKGWPFALSLLSILAAHEFGHYLAGRFHKVNVTLPFFIPFPFTQFGTMGAFIQMKQVPSNRNHLLDIAVAGPLAGLVVTIPVLLLGLSLSKVEVLPTVLAAGSGFQLEGNSLLYLALKFIVKGQLLPAPENYGAISPILYWVKYFFTGQPIPLGGMDVILHPVAWAGWAGLLVTALNLIPAGQLDGGHIFYVLFGSKGSRIALPFIVVTLILLGFGWNGWWLWVVLILFLGRAHAEPLDQISPMSKSRRWLAAFTLLIFVLVFTPIPFVIIMG